MTAVHYGTKISLRGVFGRYLGAVSTVDTSQDPPMSSDSVNYLLEADGMGLGNDLECLEFVPIDAGTADNDVLTFGSLVAIKISRAKER